MKSLNVLIGLAMGVFLAGCTTSSWSPTTSYPPAPAPRPYPSQGAPASVTYAPYSASPHSAAVARPSYARPEPWVDVSITTVERQVIQGYVASCLIEQQHPRKGKKPKGLPPGLQKKLARGQPLPPGWEMKFRRGEILPLEIYEQCHPLPREVLVKLPPPPPGTVIITLGGKVARILAATREILDVFEVEF